MITLKDQTPMFLVRDLDRRSMMWCYGVVTALVSHWRDHLVLNVCYTTFTSVCYKFRNKRVYKRFIKILLERLLPLWVALHTLCWCNNLYCWQTDYCNSLTQLISPSNYCNKSQNNNSDRELKLRQGSLLSRRPRLHSRRGAAVAPPVESKHIVESWICFMLIAVERWS